MGVGTMGQWKQLVDQLVANIEHEVPGEPFFRINIDHKMWEIEKIVEAAEPNRFGEKPQERVREFQDELRKKLSELSANDRSNRVWLEALMLLDGPQLRVPEHQRPH
jgi:hypothetical protein